jgi:hypothetical protein
MNSKLIEDIASAVLYEGYLLYPYRASALKNRQRWNFGVLYPRGYAEQQSGSDAWFSQTECLIQASADAKLSVRLRFLQLDARSVEEPVQAVGRTPWSAADAPVGLGMKLTESEERVQGDPRGPGGPPHEASAKERDIILSSLRLSELPSRFATTEPAGALVEIEANLIDRIYKLRVTVSNAGSYNGSTRDEALQHSLISAHSILAIDGGEFVSLLDPPDELRDRAGACKNIGTWPVLVGEDGQRDAMLSSPIILYDYPKIAPESPGALFDGTEIDEILTLRIMTLTDEEKLEIGRSDERARQILERTESMPQEQFMKMHGVVRNLREVQEQMP